MSDEPLVIDFTADGVQFAPWCTPVENDDLQLISVSFGGSGEINYPNDGVSLRLPSDCAVPNSQELEATFFSREQRAVVTFKFTEVNAFRVVDEGGLLEMWEASSRTPRPAGTTFRVRGHGWQAESALAWIHGADKDHYSYMIATGWECLEVVGFKDPAIELRPAIVTPYEPANSSKL
jgi:hypothetical protein